MINTNPNLYSENKDSFIGIQECDKVYRGNMTVKLKNYDAYVALRFQFNDKQ